MRKLFIALTTAMSLLQASAEVTHIYDESTKTLTISGKGEMNVYVTDEFGDTYARPAWRDLRDDVEKVVIEEGVTDIGSNAFISFSVLKEVKIASTVESIKTAAFEECKSIEQIVLPEGLKEIEKEAFYGCTSLESIKIPENVTSLPDYAFSGCKKLKSIDLGGVREFGESTFRYCGFESFVIPEGTKTISKTMFMSCTSLKTIDIPNSIEVIENEAFHYCKLDTIYFVGDKFPQINGGNNFNTNVVSVNCKIYSDEVVEILENHGCTYDTEIIPSWSKGVEIKSTNNTYGKLSVTPVDCEKNLYKVSIDLRTGYKVTWEGTYDIPEDEINSTEITVDLSKPGTLTANVEDNFVISNNVKIEVYGNGKVETTEVKTTDAGTVYKLVAIPNEGEEFNYWESFSLNLTLTEEQETNPEIEITVFGTMYLDAYFTKNNSSQSQEGSNNCGKDGGDNVTWSIENDTLYILGEGEMEEYDIYDETPYYGEVFSYIKVGEGVTNVGEAAFANLFSIKKVYLPSTITKVSVDAFAYCEDLRQIYFAGTSVPSFDNLDYTFDEIKDLVQIVVPCSAVEDYKKTLIDMKVVCGEDIPSTGGEMTIDDFTFDPANVCGADEDGSNILWAYDEATGTLALKGTGEMKDYTIAKNAPWRVVNVKKLLVSEDITRIGDYALYQQDSLQEISLPMTVESIGSYAFAETGSLKEIVLPEGLVRIDQNAFRKSGLTSVTLPTTLESIGGASFQYCHFSTITIPESVEGIGRGAFDYSQELETIIFESEIPAETGGFSFISNSAGPLKRLIVPCSAVEAYQTTPGYSLAMIQGEYPYTLKLSEKAEDEVSEIGGRAWIKQWPDCATGEAVAYAQARNGYEFSHWEAVGITLTEDQAKSDTITVTVDTDCELIAIYKVKVNTSVDDVNADKVVVTVSKATIYVNRKEFNIYDILGRDMTSANGSLKAGVYTVKCDEKRYKAVVK